MDGRHYRVFISSPSDVRPERAIAERIVRKMAREFAHHFELAPVLWEQEPLLASHHFQDEANIPAAGATDVCVVILWSRLGFTLPAEKFRGAISGREVTGTEWEFEDALKNCRERGLPDLLVYRKTADILASLADEAGLDELRRQKRLVGDFFDRWFKIPDGGSFSAASHGFATSAEFESLLEAHLRALLLRRLQRDLGLSGESGAITWSGPPWPALAPFDLAKAPIFFGRAKARNELREALAAGIAAGTAFVLVVGASGSGKSSLVQAGLLPDLMLPGMLGDVGLVRYGIIRPADAGGDTLRALAEAILSATALPELEVLAYRSETLAAQLRQMPGQIAFAVRQGLGQAALGKLSELGQARLVLVVDQLEELFTGQISAEERRIFVAALAALATSGLVWVIGTMRADFFGQLEHLPALAELARTRTYLLLPPNLAELAEIVGKPARAAGLRFEVDQTTGERLDDVIVASAARDPGALPLLSFALDALWRQPRAGAELRFSAYAELGALEGAIANHAEAVVAALPQPALAVLPALLLGLVSTQDGENLAVARAARRADLARNAAASLALDRLIAARLLIADETAHGTSVRLAHEALLRKWPRLTALIEESRDLLAIMARLREDMARWTLGGRQPDLLLPPGRRLTEGMELLARSADGLDRDLAGFIGESARAASLARRRRQRALTGAFATLSALTVAAILGAWFGFSEKTAAESSRNALQGQFAVAEARRAQVLALALQDEPDPTIVEAVALSALPEGDAGGKAEPHLLDRLVLAANAKAQRMVITGHGNEALDAAYSPDGRHIVTASVDGKARIWNAATGALELTLAGHTDVVESVAYSRDGTRIATASDDKTVHIWEAVTGHPLLTLNGHQDTVTSAVFSNDGRRIVSVSNDQSARLWDATTGAELRALTGHHAGLSYAAFSPDGSQVVTASLDHTAKIWETETGRLVRTLAGHDNFVLTAMFSPDGKRILTASNDKTARVWDAATGAVLLTLAGHRNGLSFAQFSPDGQRIATAATDKTVRLWDARTGELLQILVGHQDTVASVDFSPDGQRLLTASLDKTARVWDVGASAHARIFAGHGGYLSRARFSPDGRQVLTASYDKTMRLWDADSAVSLRIFEGHQEAVLDAGFSGDGKRIVSGSIDGSVRIWEAATGAQIRILQNTSTVVFSAGFSADGKRVLSSGSDTLARVTDATTGRTLVTLRGHANWVRSAAFSPDQQRIATASLDGTVRIWDSTTGASLRVIAADKGDVFRVCFSPDGQRLLTARADGSAGIFDAASGARLLTLSGHKGGVRAAAYSADGRRIVTASDDQTVRLWDAATGAPLMVLPMQGGIVRDAAFSPEGDRIVTASDDFRARIWDAPAMLGRNDLAFIRATSSRALDSALRTHYALPAAGGPASEGGAPDCAVADPAKRAASDQGSCHQRLADAYETANAPDLAKAFFEHALAARLLEAQGYDRAAQDERYRREALAWQLPHDEAGRLMTVAETWKPR